MPTKAEVLEAKLTAMLSAFQQVSPAEPASIDAARRVNEALTTAAAELPSIAEDLPTPINERGQFARLGVVDARYIDLVSVVQQALALVALVKDENGRK